MITEKARLSAKYVYIRCDENFQLNFTNGSSMPFWKGFYCLLSEDLQKFNTNNEFDIVASDSATIWWLSSDTLIMNVTDINTDFLSGILLAQNQLVNADSFKIELMQESNGLLMSLQNSLSTFLNAYVEANSIVDYGFQQGTITGGVAKVYIAKPSSVNKYHFNCKVSYSGSITAGSWVSTGSGHYMRNINSFLAVRSGESYVGKNLSVAFNLYDNSNSLLSGYTISNVSFTGSVSFNGSISKVETKVYSTTVTTHAIATFSGSPFTGVTYGGGSFNFVGQELSVSATGSSGSTDKGISGTESLSIVFDVDKT